jgi:uncharacterized protein YfiM (DUF2279 family)
VTCAKQLGSACKALSGGGILILSHCDSVAVDSWMGQETLQHVVVIAQAAENG